MKSYKTLFNIAKFYFLKYGYSLEDAEDYASELLLKVYNYSLNYNKTSLDLIKILKKSIKNYHIDLLRKKYYKTATFNTELEPVFEYKEKLPVYVLNVKENDSDNYSQNYIENFEGEDIKPSYTSLYDYISKGQIEDIIVKLKTKYPNLHINYFRMYYFDGYSDIEICDMYNITYNSTIRTIKFKIKNDFVEEAKKMLNLVKK